MASSKRTRSGPGQPEPAVTGRKPFFHDWKTSLLVFAGAFALRVLYLISLGDDPWVHQPIVDEIAYRNMALAFLNGAPDLYPFFRPPLWPMLMAGYYLIFGQDAGFLGIRILSAILSSLAIVSGFRIADRLFGRRNAWISAAITASAGVLLHLSATGLATSLYTLLTVEAVRLTLHAWDRRDNPHHAFPAGVLWGLAALARPNALAGAILSMLWLIWPYFRVWKTRHRQAFEKGGWLLLGVVLIVLPITMLNWVHGDDPVLISTNGGINFYLGNNASADGLSPLHPVLGPDWAPAEVEAWSAEQAGRALTPNQSSNWYYAEGLRFWVQHPGDAALLTLKKLLVTLGGTETSNNGDWRFFADRRVMLQLLLLVGFWWIAPLGFAGLLAARRNPQTVYIAVIIAVNLLVVAAFFVASRFRAPLIPLTAPFTVYAIQVMLDRQQRRRARRVLIAGIALIVGLNAAAWPFAQPDNHAYGHLVYGMLYVKEHDSHQAAEHFRQALDDNQNTPLANLYLGDLARDNEQFESAITRYRAENLLKPKYRAYRGLGICFRQLGMRDSALVAFETAYQMNPADDALRQALAEEVGEQALSAMENGDEAQAVAGFTRASEIAPENPFFSFGLAGALWSAGEMDRANAITDSLYQRYPDFVPAKQWVEEGWRPESEQ
ncbi:glycosyltransferase family 39 protein [bacterium]|nr:glycosyltransferase family 39 protein [bacterium]